MGAVVDANTSFEFIAANASDNGELASGVNKVLEE